MIVLDLFCGAGGASEGYARAGYEVVGVDIVPQPNYRHRFWQSDVMDVEWYRWLDQFDLIHASPPCQRWLGVPGALREEYPDLLSPTRELLQKSGKPYVIENVPTAPLDGPVLCGATFGLPIVRHRRFECNPPLLLVPNICTQEKKDRAWAHPGTYPYAHGAWRPNWREKVMPVVWPWMTLEETHEAIPPAYTEWIGLHLRDAIELVE